jgi:UDPglucose--hexose-1-phosphate uridylyltransferase
MNGCWFPRSDRPWQGQKRLCHLVLYQEDETCYLCPGNVRANGEVNPLMKTALFLQTIFAALKQEEIAFEVNMTFFKAQPERGNFQSSLFFQNTT